MDERELDFGEARGYIGDGYNLVADEDETDWEEIEYELREEEH